LGQALGQALRAAAEAVDAASPQLDELDRAVGDGDLGQSLRRGARAVLEALPQWPLDAPPAVFHALGLTLQSALGGTSGPLYAVFFLRTAARLKSIPAGEELDPRGWADAVLAGCQGIIELGGAGRGDRTMLDALLPARDALTEALTNGSLVADALSAAADAAEYGATATAELTPRRGRSSYLGRRAIGHVDPGAQAVALWLRAVANVFQES